MITKINKWDLWIVIMIAIQATVFLLNRNDPFTTEFTSWMFFLSGCLISIFLLKKFWKKKDISYSIDTVNKKAKGWLFVLFIATIVVTLGFLNHIFKKNPATISFSDIIPTVEELVKRFNAGEYVYTPIDKFGYHLPVTYLPMQWGPFLIADWVGFDYRWISVSIWVIAFLILIYRSFKYNNLISHFITITFSSLSYLYITYYNAGIIIHTIEMMIVGYYVLLVVSTQVNNPVIRGLVVAICLMSRYSLVLWLPVALLTLWLNEDKKKLYISILTVLIFVSIVYVIPFLSKDWAIFYNGYKYYDQSAIGEWKHINYGTNVPYHLYNGYGFAHIVYQNFPGFTILEKVKVIQKFHLYGSLLSTFISIVFYLRQRQFIHYKIFLLGSLKIYLSVFLFFIQVPYEYLMIVDFFVGIAVFSEQSKYKFLPSK